MDMIWRWHPYPVEFGVGNFGTSEVKAWVWGTISANMISSVGIIGSLREALTS
jgi:hypothetical protein